MGEPTYHDDDVETISDVTKWLARIYVVLVLILIALVSLLVVRP